MWYKENSAKIGRYKRTFFTWKRNKQLYREIESLKIKDIGLELDRLCLIIATDIFSLSKTSNTIFSLICVVYSQRVLTKTLTK